MRVWHRQSGKDAPKYVLTDRKGGVIGTTASIIDKESVRNVKGLPKVQSATWSASEKTIVIHEDMSDASPDYDYRLLIRNESGNYDTHPIKTPIRGVDIHGHNIYGYSPNIGRVTDSHVELLWSTEPKSELISVEDILSGRNPSNGAFPHVPPPHAPAPSPGPAITAPSAR